MLKCGSRLLAGMGVACAAWLLPMAAACAQPAFTTQAVNIRAGPDRAFPLVTWLPAGPAVNVVGCIDGWRWCDVVTRWERGWVYARFLSLTFRNQPVTIIYNGGWLGVPVISFSVGTYWGSHYRGRPWYGRQGQWSNWRPPPPVVRPPSRPPQGRPPPARPPQARPPSRPPQSGPPNRPPGQGPGMGPGAPPGTITRPPR
jgi:uncharacterized protein YraI